MHHHNELNVTKELVARWCITEWVKRLAGNEIELGMKIPMIESRASNIPMDKGSNVCCHNGSTDKDLRRICGSQYEHPSFAIAFFMTYTCSFDYEIMCYQTSQRNWVIINMLYMYLLRCLLSWHKSRLGFVTLSFGEVSLGPLSNTHHKKPCKQSD